MLIECMYKHWTLIWCTWRWWCDSLEMKKEKKKMHSNELSAFTFNELNYIRNFLFTRSRVHYRIKEKKIIKWRRKWKKKQHTKQSCRPVVHSLTSNPLDNLWICCKTCLNIFISHFSNLRFFFFFLLFNSFMFWRLNVRYAKSFK